MGLQYPCSVLKQENNHDPMIEYSVYNHTETKQLPTVELETTPTSKLLSSQQHHATSSPLTMNEPPFFPP